MLEYIRKLCKDKGITVMELERATHLSNGTICKWDKSMPRVDSAKAVADYFQVTIDELVRGGASA